MGDAALETVLRRDRTIVLTALVGLAALSWLYVVWLSLGMAMSASGTMDNMSTVMAPALRPWSAADFAFTFAMWAVMMIGMMTPSAAPMILLYARVGRQARAEGHVFAATGWFAAGYLLAWTVFSLVAVLAQAALLVAGWITPMLDSANRVFGAGVLIAAGLYQWTPLKDACLAYCRAPLDFIMSHGGFRPEAGRALGLGLRHGLYCVGCCWVLMALLFVGGVMNVLWIAALALFVLLERLSPGGRLVARLGGAAFAAAGAWLLLSTYLQS